MTKRFEKYIESGLDEVISSNIHEDVMLLEMARIDDPDFDSTILGNIEVWIYGGDRTPMTPHFHVFDKDEFYFEISIESLKILNSKTSKKSWSDNLSDSRKKVRKWLMNNNSDFPNKTNYEVMFMTWNQNNRSNKIPQERIPDETKRDEIISRIKTNFK